MRCLIGFVLAWPAVGRAQTISLSDGVVYSQCGGEVCDPGGPSAVYPNGQNATATLCPNGGPSAGPNTTIRFIEWDLAPGPGDHLHIHQGTEADGPPFLVGSHDDPLLGQTVVSDHPTGCLTFDWVVDGAGKSAGWKALILTGPQAGEDATADLDPEAEPFLLTDSLGGDPDLNGSWNGPGGAPCDGTFDPDEDPLGLYTYSVPAEASCPGESAQLLVQLGSSANAGSNGTLTLCTTSGVADLFLALGGTPDPGGTWTAPGGASHSSTFDPGVDAPGAYTYTVACEPQPCTDATATVTVTVNQPPDAGQNASLSVCSSAAPFDLLDELGGTPDPGGAWTGPGGAPVPSTFTPGTSAQGVYTYAVLGTPPCSNATATVTITQVNAPNAGESASITVCSNGSSFALLSRLGGTPQGGGVWTGPSGPHGATFVPGTDPAGVYTYTVNGTAPCAAAVATLTITIQSAPQAGTNASTTVCSTDASFALFGVLGGSPDGGGTWTAPVGGAFPGTFIPGSSAAGIYTYTVVGITPCANASAAVTVSVNTAPNAGTNATVARCSNAAAFNLFTQLGGSPTPGGTWTGPSGAVSATFTPGTSQPGAYTYTVTGTAPCANAQAVVTVNITPAPSAGTNGSTSVCANGASFALLGLLGGTPDPGGSWTAPGGGAHSGTFVPGTSPAGTYTYTVLGTAPCANATATVAVTVIAPPNPGTNGTLTVCGNGANVNLFNSLGGSPATGGTWTRPNGTAHTGTLNPSVDPAGTYTYTVAGTAPCAAAASTVQVTKVVPPNAGTNGSTTVCSTMAPFQLFTLLGGTPSGTGTWRTPSNGAFGGTFNPGTTPGGTYKYIVTGTSPCANDTAFVTVVVNQAPNAGSNASTSVCSSAGSFSLFSRLGGSPSPGGTWTSPSGQPFPGTYVPGTSAPGGYTYTVVGQSPCLDASAVVAVTQQRQPVAGSNGSFAVCSTDAAVDLFDELGGTPDGNGTWSAPGGGTHSGVFIPGTSAPGIYTYTVAGTSPCTNATANVTAVVNMAPDAGTDAGVSICVGASAVDLFAALDGSPDAGGNWSDDDATGQLTGATFSPAGLPPGDYDFTYTVPGNGQCGDDEATVRVTIVAALDAGTNGSLTVCGSNTIVDLFPGLGGTPQAGGTWVDLSGTGALTGQFFNSTLVPAGTYVFRYDLAASASCPADNAQVSVTVVAPRRPGTNGTTTVCSNSGSFTLFGVLGGDPELGGVWSGPENYDPPTMAPGVFTYTLAGTSPCPNASAAVTVNEVAAPIAGNNAITTVCTNGGTFNMTLRLGGSPQPGSWSFGGPHGNLFVPGVDAAGVYVYTVPGIAPCAASTATLTVNVNQAPFAGTNGSTTVCSDGSSFALLPFLGPGTSSTGSWTGPDGPHSGVYDPEQDDPGDYIYTVTGSAPCTPDVAVVTVFENERPNAGTNASASLCAGGGSVNLVTRLGGTPALTGSWTGPSPSTASFSGVFTPGVTPAGTYTYTVQGTAPCPNSSATVTVSVAQPPQAGTSTVITICDNNPAFSLLSRLGGSPQLNGTWTPPPPALTFDGVFIPGTSSPGLYTYTVTGTSPCANATATVNVIVNPRANAGDDSAVSVCSTDGALALFPLLGPNAQMGGSWIFLGTGLGHSGVFQPISDVSGLYKYRVQGPAGCGPDSAVVQVSLNQYPNAGFNGLRTVCDTDAPFPLVNYLNGSPQLNGNWTAPGPSEHTGIFVPGTNPPGVYTYTMLGTAPCPNATAQVTVFVNARPDAGENGVRSVCSSDQPFSLFDALGGSPDPGGSWYDQNHATVGTEFTPGSSLPGIYTYRLQGAAPCASDSATVTVFVNAAPNAGISAAVQICTADEQTPLISLLEGSPGTSGTWSFEGDPHGPDLDPLNDPSGAYVYTVVGIAPCTNAIAQVQVTLVPAPSAGEAGDLAACIDDAGIQLAAGLNGTPNGGGIWSDDDGTGQLNGDLFDATGLAPGAYHFTYTVSGNGPCDDATAVVTVNLAADLDAGADATVDVCGNELVELFTLLGGTPQPGGSWIDVDNSGALIGGVFNAPEVAENTVWRFDHVLEASASCEGDTARVTVNVQPGPFAGCDGFTAFCLTDAPGNLINELSCGPDNTGTWYDPFGVARATGVFVPATDAPGDYRYVVPAIGNCAADTSVVTVEVRQPANAGSNTNISFCSNDAPVDLFPLLGPQAQTGGQWTLNNVAVSGVYNPAVDGPGNYRYRVSAQSPCPADIAFVNVSEPQAVYAGEPEAHAVCSNGTPFNMRLELGGLPQQGGTWYDENGVARPQTFTPGVDEGGIYTYVVSGITPCPNDSAQLTVTVQAAPFAGNDSTIEACISQTTVDLFAALGAGAQTGGVWTDLDASGALTGNMFDPSIAGNGTFDLQYAIAGAEPCTNDFSIITVEVGTGSSAGEDSTLTICGAYTNYPLFSALGGDPDAGGTWTDLAGTGALFGDGQLNATVLPVGGQSAFTYTVEDLGCGSVQATVLVTTVAYPDPGTASLQTICASDDPFDLFDRLGGTPQTGGSWTSSNGPFNGNFDPSSNGNGQYVYTVAGNDQCADSSAVFTMVVNQPPNAGTNAQIVVCDTLVAFPLIGALGGQPAPTGAWTDLTGTGAVTNGQLNTTGLLPGEYEFLYTVQVTGCPDAIALLKVDVVGSPLVVDVVTECNEQDRTYTVSFTVERGDPGSYSVIGSPGTLSTEAPYTFISEPVLVSAPFTVFVSDGSACSEVRVDAESPCDFDTDVFIPESFSPNGDGTNEEFLIPGIEGFPNNTISVFNRWGAEVYDAAGYDNSSVVWDGSSPHALLPGSAPAGTYFYVLELGNGSAPITGFVQLVR